jgi:DNA-directed RNA polymerase subunit K/omega
MSFLNNIQTPPIVSLGGAKATDKKQKKEEEEKEEEEEEEDEEEEDDEEENEQEEDDEEDDVSIEEEEDDDVENDEEMEKKIFGNDDDNGSVNDSDNGSEKDSDEEDEDETQPDYLQKFDKDIKQKTISDYHPELKTRCYEEILALSTVHRDADGNIIDPLHKTLGVLTKYELSRVVGERAKQLSMGADSFIKKSEYLLDEYSIAMLELKEKKIPFILERPLPNGTTEYWKLADLEILI